MKNFGNLRLSKSQISEFRFEKKNYLASFRVYLKERKEKKIVTNIKLLIYFTTLKIKPYASS